MSFGQSFTKRVIVPLFVMLLTVAFLTVAGLSLFKLHSTGALAQSSNSAPSSSAQPIARPAVDVFNGTSTPGLARQVSSVLATRGWQIQQVGNWSGKPLAESTVYYPAGQIDSAKALADETSSAIQPTITSLNQSTLTLVIMK